ncbi:hypothetical protein BC629DRAFT_1444743 [Irpex lacteus]|nr:hypothetical protein BC629DRAFT_1444743 [Irpex lacteus]
MWQEVDGRRCVKEKDAENEDRVLGALRTNDTHVEQCLRDIHALAVQALALVESYVYCLSTGAIVSNGKSLEDRAQVSGESEVLESTPRGQEILYSSTGQREKARESSGYAHGTTFRVKDVVLWRRDVRVVQGKALMGRLWQYGIAAAPRSMTTACINSSCTHNNPQQLLRAIDINVGAKVNVRGCT